MVTSNLVFSQWDRIFRDSRWATAAAIDRALRAATPWCSSSIVPQLSNASRSRRKFARSDEYTPRGRSQQGTHCCRGSLHESAAS